jgi:rod shape-determining protein MreC
MSFRLRNSFSSDGKNKKRNVFLSISVILVLILIFSFSGPRSFVFGIASPFWVIKSSFFYFVSDNVNLLKSKSDLIQENFNLKQQNKKDENDLLLKDLVIAENDDLKSILSRKSSNQKSILSTILVKPTLSPYDTLIIDVGLNENISVGDRVVADGNVFIGYISEVYDNSSKVILYSSPGEKVQVLIGSSNIEKEALGMCGGNFGVSIPREIDIKEGDPIVIPSISPNLFGVVEKVEFKESDAFQKVLFKNTVNINELKWVLVIPSSLKKN